MYIFKIWKKEKKNFSAAQYSDKERLSIYIDTYHKTFVSREKEISLHRLEAI